MMESSLFLRDPNVGTVCVSLFLIIGIHEQHAKKFMHFNEGERLNCETHGQSGQGERNMVT